MTTEPFVFDDGSLPGVGKTPTLYKLDSVGRLRTWTMEMEYETGFYRTLAGLADGKQAVSGWTTPVGKQGRTDKEQGEFEVRSQVKHQLDREYHDSPDTVSKPKMIEPMLAKTYDKFPGPGALDPKLDGIRCVADVNGLWSRQGQPITAVPHIHACLASLFAANPDAVIDGELYNHDLREDFGAISSIVRKKNPTPDQLELASQVMQYHVYDLVSGTGDRQERKQQLSDMIAKSGVPEGIIHFVDSIQIATEEQLKQAYAEIVGEGYEGGIYAPAGFAYELGRRSKGLLKMKDFITEEFSVVAIEPGQGNWAGAAKRVLLVNNQNDGKIFGAGIRGSFKAGVELLEKYGTTVPTRMTATVRFFMRSPDGVPRFPVVVDFQPEGRND